MTNEPRTVIVTGASQGIGAALVKTFLERGYSVVANSRNITKSAAFVPSDKLALVDGDISQIGTATKIVETATSKFKSRRSNRMVGPTAGTQLCWPTCVPLGSPL